MGPCGTGQLAGASAPIDDRSSRQKRGLERLIARAQEEERQEAAAPQAPSRAARFAALNRKYQEAAG